MLVFDLIAGAWFFVLGSVIGSFMNVVVWRGPRGQSLFGSSRCPKCNNAIRWHDNVPIFGWLLLGGKCRDCRLPISARYPIVEFVTACLFLALALAELHSGGANLPGGANRFGGSFTDVLIDSQKAAPLLCLFALHVILLAALFCWALIRVDGQRVPWRYVVEFLLLALALAALGPARYPLYWAEPTPALVPWRNVATYGIGLLAGLAVGIVLALAPGDGVRNQPLGDRLAAIAGSFAAIGAALGWQAVLSIVVIAAALRVLSTVLRLSTSGSLRGVPLTMDVLVATVIHLCYWSSLWEIPWWPGVGAWTATVGVVAAAGIALVLTARLAPEAALPVEP
ncbi:MAG: prepilin peptidase [Planctomycetales bacterium]|nr:prepilin peptidase [Planctomycetales bacterium]